MMEPKKKLAQAHIIFFRSLNPDVEDSWLPVMPDEVPAEVQDLDVLGNMMAGNLAQPKESDYWYRAEDVSEYFNNGAEILGTRQGDGVVEEGEGIPGGQVSSTA